MLDGDANPQTGEGADAAPPPVRVLRYRPAPTKRPDLYFPSKLRDLIVPAVLLAAGVALGVGVLIHDGDSFGDAVRRASAYSVTKLLLLLVCIPLVTRFAGVVLGTLPQAALKLSVVASLPDALVLLTVSTLGCTGMVLAPVVGFVACWLLFAGLFEMDFAESGFCAAAYWAAGMAFSGLWIVMFYYVL